MAMGSPHEGKNLKRIREIMGLKQEALALKMGPSWDQRKISLLEQREVLDPSILEEVALALHIKPEAIQHFDEENAIYNIQNNYEGSNPNAGNVFGGAYNYYTTINPIEKWLEALEENKRLYESLLQSEREKVELLKQQLQHTK